MKKISLFLGSFLLLASCTSTQWAIIGDVTAYNSDGSVLRQWDDVVTIVIGLGICGFGYVDEGGHEVGYMANVVSQP